MLGGSFQLPDRRMQMGCLAQGLPDPANAAGHVSPPARSRVHPRARQRPFQPFLLCISAILISQQCIHHCPMAFWD